MNRRASDAAASGRTLLLRSASPRRVCTNLTLVAAFGPGSPGILPFQWLHKAVEESIIHSAKFSIPPENFQPASLDLRLGDRAYRLRSSFLPETESVESKLASLAMGEFSLRGGAVLEQGRPYLIPLIEDLRLPPNIRAKANPRSSTGRMDVFTRVITDNSHTFDEIRPGYSGKLYLEVVSRSFTVKVEEGLSLNQLRLINGKSAVDDEALHEVHQETPLLYLRGKPMDTSEITISKGLFLSINLQADPSTAIGYQAKKNSQLLDLSKRYVYEPDDYWTPVYAEPGHKLILEPEEFYLLLSREGVRIPPGYAADMTAYDPTSGELRTHYAGFFDPGFGHDESGLVMGSRAALEVRAHDVPFMIEEGQRVCRLSFERMAEPPNTLYGGDIGSTYQHQDVMLSKHFKTQMPPPRQLRLSDSYN